MLARYEEFRHVLPFDSSFFVAYPKGYLLGQDLFLSGFQVGVCKMDFLISESLERFSTEVGLLDSEFGSVRNPEKPQFGSENIKNIVLNFRKSTFKCKLELVQCCI